MSIQYETFFRRLKEEAAHHTHQGADERLQALQRTAEQLAREALDGKRTGKLGEFRIVVSSTEVRGFVQVELQHRRGGPWETRAFGYIDTLGGGPPFLVKRFTTLGKRKEVERIGVPVGEQATLKLIPVLQQKQKEWEESPLVA